jgi:hypothetical protein
LKHGIEIYLQPDKLVDVKREITEETEEDKRLDHLLDSETRAMPRQTLDAHRPQNSQKTQAKYEQERSRKARRG